MKKFIFVVILIMTNTGCMMLSKNYYLSSSGENVKRNNDTGGYYRSDFARFGKGNNGIVSANNYSAEIWSNDYFSKELFYGFILPIIPRFFPILLPRFGDYPGITETERWIRVTNTTPSHDIYIKGIITNSTNNNEIKFGRTRYPPNVDSEESLIKINTDIKINIPSKEHIWICLPESEISKLKIQLGNELVIILLNETKGISYWALMV